APRGVLSDVTLKWTGPFSQPASYSAHGRFQDVAARPYGNWPGFNKLAGTMELSEKSGRLEMEGREMTVAHARLAHESNIALDSLRAEVEWSIAPQRVDVKLSDVAFENTDVAGDVSGEMKFHASGATEMDLTANASRARAAAVYKYIPALPETVATWL